MGNAEAVLLEEPALVTCVAIDPAAFAAVYDHYFPRVYNYVRYRVQDSQVADDITARVFERILDKIGDYDPDRGPFGAWLFGIARNAVRDHFRAQVRRRWLSLDMLRGGPSAEPDPEEAVVRDETYAELLAAVARLSQREREIIGLKFGAGLTNRRIAHLTGLSESNVGVILYRAVRRLRTELEDKGHHDGGN